MYNLGVIGGGNRGRHMANIAIKNADRTRIIAVVEGEKNRRELFQEEFGLSNDACFKHYQDLLESKIRPDGVLITTTPDSHADPACAFLEADIPVFLEKPMATSLEDAARVVRTARKTKTPIQIGFNCRYAPFFERIKKIVSSGKLGRIISIEWKEILTPYHFSTYNWHPSYNKRRIIGSWLLEKCCHDLDLMSWLVESRCIRVTSFGNRINFTLPSMEISHEVIQRFPKLKKDAKEGKIEWKSYKDRSDLVDHQVSILEYENGVTASFSLIPLGQENTRAIYICGSKATLKGDWERNTIRLLLHESNEEITSDPEISIREEHGGGDERIISAFLDYLDDPLAKKPKTGVEEGWKAMVMACGIDLSVKEHRVVELKSLRSKLEEE